MDAFVKAKRVVVKVGTSTLTHETGEINIRRIEKLVKVLADIKNSGKEIILVTSGAIAVGVGKLHLQKKPSDIPAKQAAAAIGQCELMYIYDKLFGEYNHVVSQVLLTRDVVESEKRKQNVVNTFKKLLEFGSIPIVNENDTIAIEEIEFVDKFGDNDTLSAIVAVLCGADGLVILSDIDGLFDSDPRQNPTAKLIQEVYTIDDKILSLAGGAGSTRGTGGMITKIHAAQIACGAGIHMVIMNGADPLELYKVFDGEEIGTHFFPTKV